MARRLDPDTSVFTSVRSRLEGSAASRETMELWDRLARAFEEAGPEGVKGEIERDVQETVRAAKRDLRKRTASAKVTEEQQASRRRAKARRKAAR